MLDINIANFPLAKPSILTREITDKEGNTTTAQWLTEFYLKNKDQISLLFIESLGR